MFACISMAGFESRNSAVMSFSDKKNSKSKKYNRLVFIEIAKFKIKRLLNFRKLFLLKITNHRLCSKFIFKVPVMYIYIH